MYKVCQKINVINQGKQKADFNSVWEYAMFTFSRCVTN